MFFLIYVLTLTFDDIYAIIMRISFAMQLHLRQLGIILKKMKERSGDWA